MAIVLLTLDKSDTKVRLELSDELSEKATENVVDELTAAIEAEREAAVEEALNDQTRPVTTGEQPADDEVFAGYDPDSNGTPPKNLDADDEGKDPSDGIPSGSPSEPFTGFDPDGDDIAA